MILPAIAGAALRGIFFLGRSVFTAGRLLVRAFGSAAKWAVKGLKAGVRVTRGAIKALRIPRITKFLKAALKQKAKRLPSSVRKPLPGVQEKTLKEFESFIKEHPVRMQAIKRRALKQIAEHVRDDVRKRVSQEKELASSIEVASGAHGVHVVRIHDKAKQLTVKESRRAVLYVEPTRGSVLKRVPQEIKILQKYGPWTKDNLPYVPRKKDARVIKRLVTPGEFRKVNETRKKDEHMWRAELQRIGVRVRTVVAAKEITTVSDLSQRSMNLEFGIGDKSIPHWRPAMAWVSRGGAKQVFDSLEIKRAMLSPSYKGWKQWKASPKKVSDQGIQELAAFQKKIGLTGI